MIGECLHPEFDCKMNVEYHDWNTESKNLLPDSPWGAFRKPQIKPFLIRKFFKKSTLFLDADIFCAAPFDHLVQNIQNWSCAITKHNPDMLPEEYMELWGVDKKPVHQYNSGVLFIKDIKILDEWCAIFEEGRVDQLKYDYLMNRQPWSYDQIGLIIAAARSRNLPEKLEPFYNYEVASKGWCGAEKASIIHFTNWKIFNLPELLYLDRNAPEKLNMATVGYVVQRIEDSEKDQPAIMTVKNPIKSQKVIGLIRKKWSKRVIVGICQGVVETIAATPMLKALLDMGWQVDLPNGVFKDFAETAIKGLGVRIVDSNIIKKQGPYQFALQSVWPVRGIENLAAQTLYASPCDLAWKHNLFINEVEANMSLAYAMGYKKEIPSVYCYNEENELTKSLSLIDNPLIGLHIGSDDHSMNVPSQILCNIKKIPMLLKINGYRIVLLGWPEMEIRSGYCPEGCIDLVGKLNLAQLADAIRRLDAVVTDDRKVMQVAAAMRCPQVAILSLDSIIRNRPWSDRAQVICDTNTMTSCSYPSNKSRCKHGGLICSTFLPKFITRQVDRLIQSFPKKEQIGI
jgi:hypothetical protein